MSLTPEERQKAQRALERKRVQSALEKKRSGSASSKEKQQGSLFGVFDKAFGSTQGQRFGEALDTGFSTGFGSTAGGIQQLLGGDKERLAKESQLREQRYLAAKEKSPTGAFLGNIGGSVVSTLPLMAIPGVGATSVGARLATSGLGRGALATGRGAQAASGISKGLATTGRGAVEGGLAAGVQYVPEGESRLSNAAGGAAWGAGPAALMEGLGGAYNALKRSNMLRGGTGVQDLTANVAAAIGTDTPLGQVLQNPFLNFVHDKVLMNMPASGAVQAAKRTQALIALQGDELLENITGGKLQAGLNPGAEIQEGLKDLDFTLETAKRNNYQKVDNLAEKLGVTIGSDNFQKMAEQLKSNLTQSTRLARLLPESLKKDLETYSGESANDTLKDTNLFRAQLGEITRDAAYKNDREGKLTRGVYQKLIDALDNDISAAISKTGDKKLQRKYDEAQSFYKNEIVPLQDKLVSRYTHKNYDPDTLVSAFFKPISQGKERGVLLDKLTNLLGKSGDSENLLNSLRAGVFAKAKGQNGNIDTDAIQDILGRIGQEQRESLFSGKEKELSWLTNLSRLNQMNKASKASMGSIFNGHGMLQSLGLALPAGGAYYGYEKGNETGVPGAGVLGLLGGGLLGAGFGPGRFATKKLTSQKTRENVSKNVLSPKERSNLIKELQRQLKQGVPRASGAMSAQAEEEK